MKVFNLTDMYYFSL